MKARNLIITFQILSFACGTSLVLKIEGRDITADEYLEHAFEYKKGSDEKTAKYNEARICIRRYFKSRKCFTFERSGNAKILHTLEELTDSDLDKDFIANVEEFCRYIYRECPPKKLNIETPFTGRMFASLVVSHVNAIRNGAVPCIDSVLTAMTELENTKVIAEAVKLYDEFMKKNLSLPTISEDGFSQVHDKALEESVALFLKKAVNDTDRKFQLKMKGQILTNLIEWENINEEASVISCKEVLQNMDTAIAKKLEDGVYMCSGGYAMYSQDLCTLQEEYASTHGLGVKAKDTLLVFLKEKSIEGQTILKADEKFSAEKKNLEEQRKKAQEAERDKQASEREAALKAQHAKDMEKSMKENIIQLEKKTKEDLENMRKHNEEVLQSRLMELQETLQEGFSEETRVLQSQIDMNNHNEQVVRSQFIEEQGTLKEEAKALQSQRNMRKHNEDVLQSRLNEQQKTLLSEINTLKIQENKKNVELSALYNFKTQAAGREAALKAHHAKDVERMMKENIQQLEKRRIEDLENMSKHNEEINKAKDEVRTLASQNRDLQNELDHKCEIM